MVGHCLTLAVGRRAASLPLAPPASRIVAVDEDIGMLDALAKLASGGVEVELIAGRWPEVAGRGDAGADVAVCANVLYNVADVTPVLVALTAVASRRVVLELSEVHPQVSLSPLWRHFWGLARPNGPTADDAEAVVREVLGVAPGVERWARSRSYLGERGPETVAWLRRRLCLTSASDDEIARLLPQLPELAPAGSVTLWWPGRGPRDSALKWRRQAVTLRTGSSRVACTVCSFGGAHGNAGRGGGPPHGGAGSGPPICPVVRGSTLGWSADEPKWSTRPSMRGSFRTHVLRPTWHYVAANDLGWLMCVSGPRVDAGCARQYAHLGLDDRTLGQSNDVIAHSVGAGARTRRELVADLEGHGISTADLRATHILLHAELTSVVCSGPRQGKQHTYAAFDQRGRCAAWPEGEEALGELAWRYFSTRGPATVLDFSWWAGLKRSDARAGLEAVRSRLAAHEVDGRTYWFAERDAPGLPGSRAKKPRVDLVQCFDEMVVSMARRRDLMQTEFTKFPFLSRVKASLTCSCSTVGSWATGGRQLVIPQRSKPGWTRGSTSASKRPSKLRSSGTASLRRDQGRFSYGRS